MANNMFSAIIGAGEMGRQHGFNRLAGQAVAATDPTERNALLARAAKADASGTLALDKELRANDEFDANKAAGAARYVLNAVKTNDPQAIEGAYQAVRPYLERVTAQMGKPPPPRTFSPDMVPAMHQVVAASQGGGAGDDMKSIRVGSNGNFWAIRGGQLVDTGVAADPRTQLRDQPGMTPGLVDLRSGQVRPLTDASAPAPVAAGPVVAPDGTPVAIDPSIPPDVAARIRAAEEAGQPIPADMGRVAAPAASGSPLTAPRPAISPAEAERLALAREANQRAEESAALARRTAEEGRIARERGTAPAGWRFRPDGGLERIPGGPDASTTEDAKKAAGYAQRMENGLADVARYEKEDAGANRPSIGTALADVLPGSTGNYFKSEGRQNVEAAQLDALDAALTLNTGAAYTKEQLRGLARSYFPEPGNSPAVIEEKRQRLQRLVETARIRAAGAGGASPAGIQNTQPVVNPRPANAAPRRARNPQTGEVVELRNGQWVPVR